MKREFLLNIILLVLVNLLIKPMFIFGIDLGVQNRLGEQYGTYFALLNLAYLTQIVNDFGIQSFNNRHISQHPQLLAKYFPNLLFIKVLLGVVYIALTFLIAWLVLGYSHNVMPLLLVLLLNQVLVQMILFLRTNISGLGHYRLDSLLSSLDKLLMLITCGVLIWTDRFPLTLMSFAWAQTLALLITALVVFGALKMVGDIPVRASWLGNLRAARPVLLMLFRQSLPYALVVLLMFAYTRLDGVLLERMAGALHAEVYAGAYRLLDACNMFGYLFASLLLPMFARMLKRKEPVAPLVSMSFMLIWAGSVTLSAAIFFAREDLLRWMMPARASEYRFEVLGILIWAFVPVSVTYIFSTLLTAREKMMRMNYFFLFGIMIDLGLNLLLIPFYQASGAALAALCTQLFIAGAMVWLSVQEFGFRPALPNMAKVAGFFFAIILADYLVYERTGFPWGIKLPLCLLAGAVGLFAFRMIDLKKTMKAVALD